MMVLTERKTMPDEPKPIDPNLNGPLTLRLDGGQIGMLLKWALTNLSGPILVMGLLGYLFVQEIARPLVTSHAVYLTDTAAHLSDVTKLSIQIHELTARHLLVEDKQTQTLVDMSQTLSAISKTQQALASSLETNREMIMAIIKKQPEGKP